MTMRSASASASMGSWVTRIRVPAKRARIVRRLRRVSARVCTSSAARGSSSNSNAGSVAIARASATRWAWPPESAPRPGGRLLGHADLGEERAGAGPGRGAAQPALAEPERDVVERARGARTAGSPGTRRRPRAPRAGRTGRSRARRPPCRRCTSRPSSIGQQSREHAQERGLARAVRPEHCEHLPVGRVHLGVQRERAEAHLEGRVDTHRLGLTGRRASGRAGSRGPRD